MSESPIPSASAPPSTSVAPARVPRTQGGGCARLFLIAALVLAAAGAYGTWRFLAGFDPSRATDMAGMVGELGQRRAEWLVENEPELLEPAAEQAEPESFIVQSGETILQIAERLESRGIIRDAEAFAALARVEGTDRRVQAGEHVLRADLPAAEVLAALMIAEADQVRFTLPEGLRLEEVADRLSSAGVADREAFLALVGEDNATDVSEFPLIAARPTGASLEGYLFPDTYKLDEEADAASVLHRMLEAFSARMPADAARAAAALDLTVHEVVTLASLVERETPLPAERPQVARVYLNRLAEAPFILNADPTVQYALGFQPEQGEGGSWWKRPLLYVDLEVESPYNTYRNAGLPPGPIASPGLASLEAVLAPAEGQWQYFVANDIACDGSHVFALSFEEHQANIARYQTGECGP